MGDGGWWGWGGTCSAWFAEFMATLSVMNCIRLTSACDTMYAVENEKYKTK